MKQAFLVAAFVVVTMTLALAAASSVPVMAICTAGVGACGASFDATRPQDFKFVRKYLACMGSGSVADLSARCAAAAGIRFLNSADYHGPLVSVDDGRPIGSKPVSTVYAPTEAQQIPGAFAPVALAGGTPVKISLLEDIASNNAHAGDRFRFKAVDAVTVGGWVIVDKGAVGEAEVLSADSAGGNGHSGQLQIKFDWIYGVDGMKILLSDLPETSNGGSGKGAASTASIASYLLLGPVGLFAHNFVRGKDIVIKPDQKLQVYVAETVHITPNTRVSTADGFAH